MIKYWLKLNKKLNQSYLWWEATKRPIWFMKSFAQINYCTKFNLLKTIKKKIKECLLFWDNAVALGNSIYFRNIYVCLYVKNKHLSVQFSHSVLSDSLRPDEPQHSRPPCPSPTPRVQPNPCPSSRWCHPTVSSSVIPFSSCPQSFPVSGSFRKSQLFASGGQSTGVSASTSVLPMNTQDWFPLGWTGWISLQSKGLSRVFSNTTVHFLFFFFSFIFISWRLHHNSKHQFFGAQFSL